MTNAPEDEDIARIASIVGAGNMVAGEAMAPYLREPRDHWRGVGAAVAKPGATQEVSKILAFCSDRRIAVVPFSGGTGLVGGQTKPDGPPPLLLSLERMNRIRAILPEDGAIIVEAGCILADVKKAADEKDLLFPLSLASEGSCRIGGNLATNAGGVQVLRYGNARDLVLDLEAVLADGTVMEGTRALRKDNMGLDLRNLLIGSEGALGVITAAALKLYPRPGEIATAMLTVEDPRAGLALFHAIRNRLGDSITAFELINKCGIDFIRRFHDDFRDPLPGDPLWRVLVEMAGPREGGLAGLFEAAVAEFAEGGSTIDGIVAGSEAQRQAMWWIREAIPEANRKTGAVVSTDISLPMSSLPAFIDAGSREIAAIDESLVVNCFGHIGDGNLHYNVYPAPGRTRSDYDGLRADIKRRIHDLVHEMNGSVSAEHGVGRLKLDDLAKYSDPGRLAAMRAIKRALDPHGILNPGAVIPVGSGQAERGGAYP